LAPVHKGLVSGALFLEATVTKDLETGGELE
jgi:hypothetical protein